MDIYELREIAMRMKAAGICVVATAFLATSSGAWAMESPDMFIHAVNRNADHTVSMKEVDAYAMKRFDLLKQNSKYRTLSMAEIGERMTPAAFKAADTSHRRGFISLSKAEFKAYVNKLFVAANVMVAKGHTAASGSLSARELTTPAGRKLIRLLE